MFMAGSKGWIKLFLVGKEKFGCASKNSQLISITYSMGAIHITKSRLLEVFTIKCCFSVEEKYLH